MQVEANRRWNDSGLDVAIGDRVTISASGTWWDSRISCGSEGYERPWLNPMRWTRRCRAASWFELIAVVGCQHGPYHRIGTGGSFVATRAGRVQLFANDAWIMYWNNSGAVDVEIMKEAVAKR